MGKWYQPEADLLTVVQKGVLNHTEVKLKSWEERPAITQHEAGIHKEWAEAFAK